jgi:hypothetical protein
MPDPPRYTERPLPPYRHVLGRTPHPIRHPDGHSYGLTPALPVPLGENDWRNNAEYLYGVDLFNHGFWWESHEAFEGLWHVSGRRSPVGHCLQAVIQCAAAHLQAELGRRRGAEALLRRARLHAAAAGPSTLGLDLDALLAATRSFVLDPEGPAARLRLVPAP